MNAGEVIHEVAQAMVARATVRELAEAIHAFPDFAEGVKAAAQKWLAGGRSGAPQWLLTIFRLRAP